MAEQLSPHLPPDVTEHLLEQEVTELALEQDEQPVSSQASSPFSSDSMNFQSVYNALRENEFLQTIYQSAPSRDTALGFADSTRKDLFSVADSTVKTSSKYIEELQLSKNTADTLESIYRPVYGIRFGLLLEAVYPRLEPFLTSISDPETQRVIINRIVFGSIFSILFIFGLVIYSIFYQLYIPVIERSMDIFMLHSTNSIIGNIDLNSPMEDLVFSFKANYPGRSGILFQKLIIHPVL
jgi:hypothetical protein